MQGVFETREWHCYSRDYMWLGTMTHKVTLLRCSSGVASGSFLNTLDPFRTSPGRCFLIDFDFLIPFSIIGMLYNRCILSIEFRLRSIFRILIFQKHIPKIIDNKMLVIAIRSVSPRNFEKTHMSIWDSDMSL